MDHSHLILYTNEEGVLPQIILLDFLFFIIKELIRIIQSRFNATYDFSGL